MSTQVVSLVTQQSLVKGTAHQVFSYLGHRTGHDRDTCWPSINTIARDTRLGRRTVQRAIKAIEATGQLVVLPGGGRRSNTYKLKLVNQLPLFTPVERPKRRVKSKESPVPTSHVEAVSPVPTEPTPVPERHTNLKEPTLNSTSEQKNEQPKKTASANPADVIHKMRESVEQNMAVVHGNPKLPPCIPDHFKNIITESTWHAYLEIRRKRFMPVTQASADRIFMQLDIFYSQGDDPNEILNNCIMYGSPWLNKPRKESHDRGNKPRPESFNERSRREARETLSAANACANQVLRKVEGDFSNPRRHEITVGDLSGSVRRLLPRKT